MKPNYPAGTRFFCTCCDSHIATLQRSAFFLEMVTEEMLHPTDGQGPWKNGESMSCRKCGDNWAYGHRLEASLTTEPV